MEKTIEIIAAGYESTELFLRRNFRCIRENGIRLIISDNAEKALGNAGSDGLLYIHNDSNRGYAAALNEGFRSSNADYVLLCNDDVVLSCKFLSELREKLPLYSKLKADIVGFSIIDRKGRARSVFKNDYSPWFIMYAFSVLPHILSLFTRKTGYIGTGETVHYSKSSKFVKGISGACMLVKSNVFSALGGFDERYFLTYEETDFFIRARKKRRRIFYDNDLKVFHEHGITDSYASKSFSFRSMRIFITTHYGKTIYGFIRIWILLWAIMKMIMTGSKEEFENISKA